MKTDTTKNEVARMIAAGMEQLTPRQLEERLERCGYRVDKESCFCYTNTANELSYKAKAMGYRHIASGGRFAHIDTPRDTLPTLQGLRFGSFVFHNGRIWEL